jgi:hypothetical protein
VEIYVHGGSLFPSLKELFVIGLVDFSPERISDGNSSVVAEIVCNRKNVNVLSDSFIKKRDLLEIMLRQGEEIDKLRAQVAELETKLEDRQFSINRAGSIAEASLAVTDIFKEAEKAAMIYLENIRSKVK